MMELQKKRSLAEIIAKKPFLVYWENECGYGTEHYATEQEQKDMIEELQRQGTEAWKGYDND